MRCTFLSSLLLLLVVLASWCPGDEKTKDAAKSKSKPAIRIALLDIELDSKKDAAQRLDRIGAEYEMIPPNAPLARLREFDVVYFSSGWGTLSGLASLTETYREYVEGGGGLLFAQPDADGDPDSKPALNLLPYPLTVSSYGATGGQSVRAYPPGQPHPLMHETDVSDLPYPSDAFVKVDPRWTVLAVSRDAPQQPTLLAAAPGEGRVLLHTNWDDYGRQHYFKDRFVVRILKWLAGRPDEEVKTWEDSLGPRRYPEFVRRLKSDYERLITREPAHVRAAMKRAEQLLRHDAQQGSTWTAYSQAMELLHQHRSKAAIPLMLALLADEALSHGNYDASIYQTFVLLTGRPVVGKAPEEIARRWWVPQQEEMTVDVGEMSDEERAVVLGELLKVVEKNEPHGMGRDQPLSPSGVEAILKGGFRLYGGRYRDVLHPSLLPMMLQAASDRERRWLLLGPLAAMYRLGRAKELPQLVRDDKVPDAQRVIAAAALYRAGESTPVNVLVEMFRTARALDLQKAIVWLLGQRSDPAAVETVVGALSHPRAELHDVAAIAVAYQKPPAAIEPLAQRLRDRHAAGKDAYWFAYTLGRIEDPQTAPVLAQLLAEMIKAAGPQDDILGELLSAFSTATGKSFHELGSNDEERARKALAWWRAERE